MPTNGHDGQDTPRSSGGPSLFDMLSSMASASVQADRAVDKLKDGMTSATLAEYQLLADRIAALAYMDVATEQHCMLAVVLHRAARWNAKQVALATRDTAQRSEYRARMFEHQAALERWLSTLGSLMAPVRSAADQGPQLPG